MSNAETFIKTLKTTALDAVNAQNPVNICFGTVESVSPLKIKIEQKLTLGETQILLTRNVTDFKTEVTINWSNEIALNTHTHTVRGSDSAGDNIDIVSGKTDLSHCHAITGKKEIIIHNSLVVGDEVLLIKQQGGQKYIVVDRMT